MPQVSIPQAVSTVATASMYAKRVRTMQVSIPQAVSTVATGSIETSCGRRANVSIPQAVSTVATVIKKATDLMSVGFNTASGKHCCNWKNAMEATKTSVFQYRKR